MLFDGVVYDEKLLRRFYSGEELELVGAFSEGVYFNGPCGIVLIHDSQYGSLPFGIAVRAFSGSGRELGLVPGSKAVLSSEGLRGIGYSLQVLVSPGRPYRSVPYMPSKESLYKLYRISLSVLGESERASLLPYCIPPGAEVQRDKLTDDFARAGLGHMLLFRSAIAKNDSPALPEALSGLIGLGRGLTPSFDDFLTGMLFALNYSLKTWGLELPILSELSLEITKQAARRTGVISAAYLLASAGGGDFSMLRECLEPLGTQQAMSKMRSLLLVGGSSGADMLSGMAFAIGCILTLKHLQ